MFIKIVNPLAKYTYIKDWVCCPHGLYNYYEYCIDVDYKNKKYGLFQLKSKTDIDGFDWKKFGFLLFIWGIKNDKNR